MSRARETSSDARLQAQQMKTQTVPALNLAGNLSHSLNPTVEMPGGARAPFARRGLQRNRHHLI